MKNTVITKLCSLNPKLVYRRNKKNNIFYSFLIRHRTTVTPTAVFYTIAILTYLLTYSMEQSP